MFSLRVKTYIIFFPLEVTIQCTSPHTLSANLFTLVMPSCFSTTETAAGMVAAFSVTSLRDRTIPCLRKGKGMLFLKALQEEQFSITVHAGQAYRLRVAGGLEAGSRAMWKNEGNFQVKAVSHEL